MPIKVLDSSGAGDDTVIAAGIVWAVDHGADVVNLSLGGPGTTPDLTAAVAYAVRKGAVVIAAAGNSGTTTPFYPAADPNALSVAATTSGDAAYTWSNYGQWVDVAAPGCNLAPIRGGGVGNFCGTSSAAPVVAGLVALARSLDATASPGAVTGSIERTASPLPSVVHYGRINAAQALTQLRAAPTPPSSASRTFKGVLDRRHRVRTYTLPVGPGAVTATLRFKGTARLSLTAGGSSAAGASPVLLQTTSAGGGLKLSVRGRTRRAPFTLTVSYVRAT